MLTLCCMLSSLLAIVSCQGRCFLDYFCYQSVLAAAAILDFIYPSSLHTSFVGMHRMRGLDLATEKN